jgi:hypothetical protein
MFEILLVVEVAAIDVFSVVVGGVDIAANGSILVNGGIAGSAVGGFLDGCHEG